MSLRTRLWHVICWPHPQNDLPMAIGDFEQSHATRRKTLQKNQELVARIAAVAEARGTTVSQLSLAWLYQRAKDVDIPMVAIPGTTKEANATSNIASLDLSLTEQEMDDLAELGKLVAGERGNEGYKAKALERWL